MRILPTLMIGLIIVLSRSESRVHAVKHACHCNCLVPMRHDVLANGKSVWNSGALTTSFYTTSCDWCTVENCPVFKGPGFSPYCTTRCETIHDPGFWKCVYNWWYDPMPEDSAWSVQPIEERGIIPT